MSKEIIKAQPTKEFFINMLTTDITLDRVIIDLIDNSIDGSKRIRGGEENLKGLWINLDLSENFFRIADNCGGISKDIALNYAFRFGRPTDAKNAVDYSVGRFGVGMKRALFKMGKRFQIVSRTPDTYFEIEIDVEEWIAKDEWVFEFSRIEESPQTEPYGTTITVTKLYDNVKKEFGLENKISQLKRDIENAVETALKNGLTITVNGVHTEIDPLKILYSKEIKPAFIKKEYPNELIVKIYAGIGIPNPSEAGWYLYCNGRLVLSADKTNLTGWSEKGDSSTITPLYHNEFAMFRGFVFFEARDASMLPLTTTKTGIDADSPIYRAIRLEMISLMRPVFTFLRSLSSVEDRESIVNKAKSISVTEISYDSNYYIFQGKIQKIKRIGGTISYSMPLKKIETVKNFFNVKSNKEVGEKTFDYFYSMECEDE